MDFGQAQVMEFSWDYYSSYKNDGIYNGFNVVSTKLPSKRHERFPAAFF